MNRSRLHRLWRQLSGSRERGPLVRYGAAIAATAAGAGISGLVEWGWSGNSFAPLLAAVGFSVVFGGVGPGLLSMVLGGIGSAFLLLEPLYSIEIGTKGGAIRLALFVFSALLLIGFGEWAGRARRRAVAANRLTAISEASALDARRYSEHLAGEIEQLHVVAVALGGAVTRADVMDVVTAQLFDALEASTGRVYVVDEPGESLELIALHGVVESAAMGHEPIPLSESIPVADVIRSRQPLWLGTPSDWASYPDYERWARDGIVSGAAIPLLADDRAVASIFLGFAEERVLTDGERRFVHTVAGQAAQPLERARLHEAESNARAAAEELSLRSLRLQVISESLSSALTPSEVGEVIIRQGLPALGADRGAIFMQQEGENVELLGAAGYPPDYLARSQQLRPDESTPVLDVIRSGETLALESPEDIASRYPALEDVRDRALVCVPLFVDNDAVGAIQIGFASPRRFDSDRRAFLSIVARQCAAALERARRYETEREIAETLQRSVIPERLPELPGIGLAARYLPGTSGLDVGGDWYDVIPLREGRVGVVVGDVMGKGVRAAAAMAQLRNGLRAYALEGYKPGVVLERLNRLAESAGAPFATVVYVVVDQATGIARYASAGHPPVLLARADGGRELLVVGSGLPLAVDPNAHYRTGVVELEPGDLLLLYTDGLVESRQRPITEGVDRLVTSVRPDSDLDHVLAEVLDALVESDDRSDDIAILALRLEANIAPLDLELPRAMPSSLPRLRTELMPWLELAGATGDQRNELAVATWEALANALEHPQAPEESYIRIHAERRDGEIVVTVSDFGSWKEPVQSTDRGLGLSMMEGLVTELEVDRDSADGTVVRLRRTLEDRTA